MNATYVKGLRERGRPPCIYTATLLCTARCATNSGLPKSNQLLSVAA